MIRGFNQAIFQIFVISLSFLLVPKESFSQTSTRLNCFEFQSILHFVEQQHLRFETMGSQEKSKLFDVALSETPDALRILGYPMLAARFAQMNFSAAIPTQNKTTAFQMCEAMASTTFRAAFLKAFTKHLDPYSDFYLTEELDTKSSALEGEFVGVGIGTESEDGALRVTEVVAGGPAENKIFVDDRILSIDGHSVRGLNEMEVRQRIRGDRGTRVAFVGKRAGKAFTTILTRDIVHQRSVESSWLDNQVLVIKIHRFFRQTAQEVERIVETDGLKAKGFILDLRNNPGGLLQGARDVVDLFVSQGVVVYLKGRGVEDQVWALREGGELKKPIVVLINGLTASAAEIVAGALQDYGRAILVGQKTYGKGSVQNIYETQSAVGTQYRGGLKLTTLWYYLPSGRSVKSLDPDIKIASHDEAEFVHPMMPYSGASRIPVKQVADFGKAHFDKRASSLIERFQDTQEAGKALLLKMLAGNQARALSDQ